jgi:23S rRNA (cytidine1920-2'-O)/16S rRNA (cytidine1409-2'-O)-methyltransferase
LWKNGPYSCNLLLTNHLQHSALHRVLAVLTRRQESISVKTRLDKLLVDRGLTPSRERAQALILAGKVLVNEQKSRRRAHSIDSGSTSLRLLGEDLRYVSRGGLKLEKALEHWRIDLRGKVCLDIGASTGGFSDCMLQHGAARVIAVDTGYGQMDFALRNDPRIRLLGENQCPLSPARRHWRAVDFIAMDVSFISATLVLPAVIRAASSSPGLAPNLPTGIARLWCWSKPQFEAGRELVGKGGIVRDESAQRAAVAKVEAALAELGCGRAEWIESPILGGAAKATANFCSTQSFRRLPSGDSVQSEVRCQKKRKEETPKTCPSLSKAQLARKPLPSFRSRDVPSCAKCCPRSKNGCSSTITVVMDEESAAYFSAST